MRPRAKSPALTGSAGKIGDGHVALGLGNTGELDGGKGDLNRCRGGVLTINSWIDSRRGFNTLGQRHDAEKQRSYKRIAVAAVASQPQSERWTLDACARILSEFQD